MEPGHVGRVESIPTVAWAVRLHRRNGARPRGPGGVVGPYDGRKGQGAAMEPGHVGRVELSVAALDGLTLVAAMEPGHVGRVEIEAMWWCADVHLVPQWSPATWAGWRSAGHHAGDADLEPQWSPVTWAEWSAGRSDQAPHRADAAMEPGHVGRVEAAAKADGLEPGSWPQWSPATWAGWSGDGVLRGPAELRAAMEPGHVGRVEPDDLSFEDAVGDAAMEPGHVGRVERTPHRPRAAGSTCRNGARPRGPGGVQGSRCCQTHLTGRNGARPRGPGGAVHDGGQVRSIDAAAMEPGHVGRVEDPEAGEVQRAVAAAMEPGHVGRVEAAASRQSTPRIFAPQWSPATWAGWSRERCNSPTDQRLHAAMEPGHVGRVESGVRSEAGTRCSRRNGARPRGPGGVASEGLAHGPLLRPQWSPATWAGWRSWCRLSCGHDRLAAMEPGHVGRVEQVRGGRPGGAVGGAAMEPGHVGRVEVGRPRPGPGCIPDAAMEPGHVGRVEPRTGRPTNRGHHRRNGARPRGPGGAVGEDGWGVGGEEAAMEPGHVGRVERWRRPRSPRRARCRNGARPRGPGGGQHPALHHVRFGAAMEPGHVGRVESLVHATIPQAYDLPQWSPATWAGWSGFGTLFRGIGFSTPQWSPATWAGWSCLTGETPCGTPAAMEPGHVGRVEPALLAESVPNRGQPQWSPATWAGWRAPPGFGIGPRPPRRNGARPRGPGGGVLPPL